ncbi:MAG: YbaK/EbsC family protein [Clostridia bacterium]|nr:YbaK/EbsC family protein [Clostridia bacterium]
MSVEKVRNYLSAYGVSDRIREFDVSSATVELAAAALGTDGARIAKTLSFARKDGGCMLIVCAGDYKIDNRKFKDKFGFKATMLSHEDALAMTGHAVGGVCPFALPTGVEVYLDISMKRFETVFPAAGSSNSAIELSCDELFEFSQAISWEDLCKPRE